MYVEQMHKVLVDDVEGIVWIIMAVFEAALVIRIAGQFLWGW